jgi:lysylphosphatidylglycerol synthetase-like protein (DUF2156 family)
VAVFGIDPPNSKAYDLLLLLHGGVALVALVSIVASAFAARSVERARPGEPWPPSALRFFTPGPEIAGRSIYLVPLTGVALLASSRGSVSATDAFVQIGIGLWILAALVAELAVFAPGSALRRLLASSKEAPEDDGWRRPAVRLRWGVDIVALLIIAAAVVMVAQP